MKAHRRARILPTNMSHLLLVEDDPALGVALERLLASRMNGVSVARVDSVAGARRELERAAPEVILTDLRLGDGSGLDLLKIAADLATKPAVILLTGNASLESAVEALRFGAFDYLQKPYEDEHLVHTVRRAFESWRLRDRVRDLAALTVERAGAVPMATPVQADRRTAQLFADAVRLAAADAPVLLTGESGTGKEVVARFIHSRSRRASEAFVALNCAAIPEPLLEAELFGYEKGAFTGAAALRKGKFELASGGTLFLDEIGELPQALQPKLLRVLDGHGFLRLGGQSTISSDARIIAATNRKIDEEVAAGRFRDDLFFRLNVGRLHIPPLRERRADIPPLVDRFVDQLRRKYHRPELRLSEPSRKFVLTAPWPGNVRELQNVIERAALLSPSDEIDLSEHASSPAPIPAASAAAGTLAALVEAYERTLIQDALQRHNRNKASVARALGLSKQLLNYKLKKYGLS